MNIFGLFAILFPLLGILCAIFYWVVPLLERIAKAVEKSNELKAKEDFFNDKKDTE